MKAAAEVLRGVVTSVANALVGVLSGDSAAGTKVEVVTPNLKMSVERATLSSLGERPLGMATDEGEIRVAMPSGLGSSLGENGSDPVAIRM